MSKYGAVMVQKRQFCDSDEESYNGYDSELSNGYESIKRMKTYSVISGDDEIKRKPTRRPDPKVTNRNALMARENRKKQKERLERLELENSMLSKKNVELQRLLKEKDGAMGRLQKEYYYLKSVIANKTSILKVLNTLASSKLPMTSSLQNFSTTGAREKSPATESTASSGYESPNLNEATANDYEMDTNALATELWSGFGEPNDILSDFDPTPKIEVEEQPEFILDDEVVRGEHSYSEVNDPGVCVHISNQRVSIEFCASCHNNAADGWLEH